MTQLDILQTVLGDGNWHSTDELVQRVGHRFSATVHIAVKKRGYAIEKRRMTQNPRAFEYRWINAASCIQGHH